MIQYFWKKLLTPQLRLMFGIQLILLSVCAFIRLYPMLLIRDVVDLAVYGHDENMGPIIVAGALYLVVQISQIAIESCSKYLSSRMQAQIAFHLQKDIYSHISEVSLQSIPFHDSAQLSSTLAQDTQFIGENAVRPFTGLVSSVLTFLFGIYFMAQINGIMIFVVLPLGFICSLSIRIISRLSYENLLAQREWYIKLWKVFTEGILGFLPLRFHHSINRYSEKIASQGRKLEQTSVTQGKIESISHFATSVSFMATIGLIMIISALLVVKGRMTLGGLTAVMMYNHMLSDPLLSLQEITHKVQQLKVSLTRVLDIMELPWEEKKTFGYIREIRVIEGGFSYGDQVILKHVNLRLVQGQSLMITGRSGTGKTTMANLISGIYEPDEGRVLFFDFAGKEGNRPRVSYMLQDEYIFDDTVKNNILVGNEKLKEEELGKIIQVCQLEEVMENHKGPVGDNGEKLSGGERKRVLIARAIADTEADLYIFDEMSPSLDHQTFIGIWNQVDHYLKGKMRIYIEHNLAVKDQADQVVDIKNFK